MLKYIKIKDEEVKMQKNNCLLSLSDEEGILTVVLGGEIDHHSAVRVRTEIDEAISSIRPS